MSISPPIPNRATSLGEIEISLMTGGSVSRVIAALDKGLSSEDTLPAASFKKPAATSITSAVPPVAVAPPNPSSA